MSKSGSSRSKRHKDKEYDLFLKVVVVGRSGVGKSCMMLRFTDGDFNEMHVNTIGVDFRFKMLAIRNRKVKMQIWDTAGQEKFRTISGTYYRGADAVILVYDITSAQSFDDLQNFWVQEVAQYGSDVSNLILVGNKSDLHNNREVPGFKDQYFTFNAGGGIKKAIVFEVSAKTGEGVDQMFESIALNHMLAKEAKHRASRSVLSSFKDAPLQAIKEEDERELSQDPSSNGKGKDIMRDKFLADDQDNLNRYMQDPLAQAPASQKLSSFSFSKQNQQKTDKGSCSC